jgi:signal transduction histidine kinase
VNLFENGCKYSPDKRCTATLFGANQTVFVRFENGGPGIDPADLPHLFTPFYRGQNKHLAHGHGIGLPLARRIIALHGGIIAVESAPGLGASFTVSLPG